jgi:hypothetical protein
LLERGRVKILEEFLNKELEAENLKYKKNKKFVIILDKEVNNKQYKILKNIN